MPDHPGIDRNVVIVGGGQTGTVFAFALRRAGVCKVTVIDSAADKASAGICANCARVKKLRKPKTLVCPGLGVCECLRLLRRGVRVQAARSSIAGSPPLARRAPWRHRFKHPVASHQRVQKRSRQVQ
nr:NAD(P)-binding protein [Burkholderia sp. PAMC 26561]